MTINLKNAMIEDLVTISPRFASMFDNRVSDKVSTILFDKDSSTRWAFVVETPGSMSARFSRLEDAYNSVSKGGVILDESFVDCDGTDADGDAVETDVRRNEDGSISKILFCDNGSFQWFEAWTAQDNLNNLVQTLRDAKQRHEDFAKNFDNATPYDAFKFLKESPLLLVPDSRWTFRVEKSSFQLRITPTPYVMSDGTMTDNNFVEMILPSHTQESLRTHNGVGVDEFNMSPIVVSGNSPKECYLPLAKRILQHSTFDGSLLKEND